MGLRGIGAKPVDKPPLKQHAVAELSGSRSDRVIQFLESLPVTSGTLVGTTFKARPWQRARIIEPIYRTDEKGKRMVRSVVITMPRKNGKTGLIAGLALCHLAGPEAVERGQLYAASAERNQAGLIYEEMKAIIERVPSLAKRIIVRDFTKKLEDVETGSTFTALSSDAKTKHGFNSSFIVFDELAQVRDAKLYEALISSTGAREEPLSIVISTQSPDPNHIMSLLVDEAERIQNGDVVDERMLGIIFAAPLDADPWSEETWFACNPALGDFRSLEEMRDYAAKAKRMPALEGSFRNLYLNQRISEETRFIPKTLWDRCRQRIDPEVIAGKACWGGLDLSATKNDLTALALDFVIEGKHVIQSFFWKPEEYLEDSERKDHVPYREWVRRGFLDAIPGPVIDYAWVAHKLGELSIEHDIQAIACDRFNLERLQKELTEIGIELKLIPHGQGFKDFSPAIEALEDCVLTNDLIHDGNPVLNWNIENVMVVQDPAGNRKFDKRRATGRIDGAVALAMACNIAKAQAGGTNYVEGNLLVI